jgi:tetratricopeptide (TPR) repeat protein
MRIHPSRPWYYYGATALLLLLLGVWGFQPALDWWNRRAILQSLNRAEEAVAKGDVDLAITCYGEVVRLDPNNADAYYYRGNLYRLKGENDEAVADYTEAIRLNPDLFLAYVNRAAAHKRKGEPDQAIADFSEAIRRNYPGPGSVVFMSKAYRDRGDAYVEKGEYDKAIADFSEAIRLGSEYADAYDSRGTAYGAKGQLDRALADFNQAIRLDPKCAGAYYNRGLTYWKRVTSIKPSPTTPKRSGTIRSSPRPASIGVRFTTGRGSTTELLLTIPKLSSSSRATSTPTLTEAWRITRSVNTTKLSPISPRRSGSIPSRP